MKSIIYFLPFLVAVTIQLLGVTHTKYISYYNDDAVLQPIIRRSQQRCICAELCMSGLGGAACGSNCDDITPMGLPLLSQSKPTHTISYNGSTHKNARDSVCPVLCKNQLGYPLCNCEKLNPGPGQMTTASEQQVDFFEICAFFCQAHDYQIYGCQKCEIYKSLHVGRKLSGTGGQDVAFGVQTIDWDKWCKKMCMSGEGGAACNCDLLPMSLKV